MQGVFDCIFDGGNYYIMLDVDGMDFLVMFVVVFFVFGGVFYYQFCVLLQGFVCKGCVVGMDIVEMIFFCDVNDVIVIVVGCVINMIVGVFV